jgi:hypothetical protein
MHVVAEFKQLINECGDFNDPYHGARPLMILTTERVLSSKMTK